MPFTSCIKPPRFCSFIQIHEWQLVLTERDKAAAALMSVFEHKHNAILENREFDRDVRDAARAAGLQMPPEFKFWFAMTDEELIFRAKIARKEAIYKGIEILRKKGFVQTDAPPALKNFLKSGRRKWFRFRPDVIQPLIDKYDFGLWGKRDAETPPNAPDEAKPKAIETVDDLIKSHGESFTATAREVFADYQKLISPNSIPDPKRLKLIIALLKFGFAPERLFLATRGILMIPHNMGATDGRTHLDFDLIFRDSAHVERYERAATDAGLTVENFRDYVITKKNPRLILAADVEKKKASDSAAASGKFVGESAVETYTRIAEIIADGVSVLENNDSILNKVAGNLSPDDFFIRDRLIESVRTAAETRTPLDKSGLAKVEKIVAALIELQKGL